MGKGKTGSIRQNTMDRAQLNAMERHGKRLDHMGPSRQVRDVEPLVYGTLDLAEARDRHMEGVQQQGNTEAVHMFVQFPTDLPGADTLPKQQRMLSMAVEFANAYHGGDAVFAARLDRDEKGRHGVDVFLMPRYDFHTKTGGLRSGRQSPSSARQRPRSGMGRMTPERRVRPYRMRGLNICEGRACDGWNHHSAKPRGRRTGWSQRLTAWPKTACAWTPKGRLWRPVSLMWRQGKRPS